MVKGFRPGKEPPQLRKQRAKQQYGSLTATQERLVELFAERTPAESRKLIRRWIVGLLAAAIGLAVVAAVLVFLWSPLAGVVVGVLAVAALYLWWRMRRQRDAFEAMADVVSGPGRGRKR
ncbi:MAG: hypothetical protein ACOCUW_01275 [Gemmatimonadota bacterium]